jgi:hypothetical protein
VTYVLVDRDGYRGPFASTMGLKHMREVSGPMMGEFFRIGGAITPIELANVISECRASDDPDTKKAADLLAQCSAPVMISDGTERIDQEEPEEIAEATRRPIGGGIKGSVIYEDNKATAYFDGRWRACAKGLAVYAKQWTSDARGRIRVTIIQIQK